MRPRYHILVIILITVVLTSVVSAAPDPTVIFQQRWNQYDQLVANGAASRSWTWGPVPITHAMVEHYFVPETYEWHDRQVQYFDKGRMEILDLAGDTANLWYVTSGRLPIDLMLARTGHGLDAFPNQWQDSYITAIGDPNRFPTYLDLQPLYESPGQPRPDHLNQPATDILDPNLHISHFADYAADPATILREGLNGHLVPQAFVDFMNQQGPTLRDDRRVSGRIYDPLYVFGMPMTPAVWVRAQVGGVLRPILFQVFERRVLTYNPANPPAFQVEMGNVGAHTYDWLTNPDSKREFDYAPTDGTRMVATQDPMVIYTVEMDVQFTEPPMHVQDTAVYRIYRSLDGGQTRELRYTGNLGPACWSSLSVTLLPPRNPQADPGRIGLLTYCAQNPSYSRGFGGTVYSSYDGAQTFFIRGEG